MAAHARRIEPGRVSGTLTMAGLRLKDHWLEQRAFMQRAFVAVLVAGLLLSALIWRLVDLQIVQHQYYADLSQGNRIRIEPIPPIRGLIYDRNGVLLAENVPAFQLALIPEEVPDMDETLDGLTELGLLREQDLERVESALKKHRRFDPLPLRFRLDEDEVARFAVRRHEFPGVDIHARLARTYPFGLTGVHAIGYVASISEQEVEAFDSGDYAGTTHTGKTGVEKRYESYLHGEVGYRRVLVNARGRVLEILPGQQAPNPGSDVYLSIDIKLQQAAEAALGDYSGSVVVLDVHTGDVLALASLPAFDPVRFGEGLSREEFAALQKDPRKPLFNRALRGNYPPGSTIKPVLGLAALHYNLRGGGDSTMCRGEYFLKGNERPYRDWKREGHGATNLHEAIVESCDVFFYELANDLKIDRIHAFMSRFGFGELTGIDIDGEKSGLLPSRDWKRRSFAKREDQVWFPGETIIAGIGQGFMLATPLQLAHVTATLAANGHRTHPRLATRFVNPTTGLTTETGIHGSEPVSLSDTRHWQTILDAMTGVVNDPTGTARAIGYTSPYKIAGKTGTAQVFSLAEEEEYDEEAVAAHLRDHSLFVAYAPAESPQIALSVVIENGGSGSSTAAPIARKVLDAWFLPGEKTASVAR